MKVAKIQSIDNILFTTIHDSKIFTIKNNNLKGLNLEKNDIIIFKTIDLKEHQRSENFSVYIYKYKNKVFCNVLHFQKNKVFVYNKKSKAYTKIKTIRIKNVCVLGEIYACFKGGM